MRLLLLLALSLIPTVALAADNEQVVGPFLRSDGTKAIGRLNREGATVTADMAGRYYEPTLRGQIFTVATAAGGTTIVAANVNPVATNVASFLTLYNPIGSGVNLEVLKVYINHISGTPGAGGWTYNVACSTVAITAAQNATAVSNLLLAGGGSSVARGFTQTALTQASGPAQIYLGPLVCAPFAAAIAGTTVSLNCLEEPEGSIVIPPSCYLTLAPVAIGTSVLANARILFRQAPITP